MSSNYADLKEKIVQVKLKLKTCAQKLGEIEPAAKGAYPNPQLRLWSGDIKDMEEFATGLEEWLSHPLVAEAKRYLSEIRKWSETPNKITMEEVEKDWRFLSDNVEQIKQIHKEMDEIEYEAIKKIASTWVLKRVIEKDIEHAQKWATNANKFAGSVKQLENMSLESKLAQEVKSAAVKELLKVSSFDNDNIEAISKFRELVDKSENMVKIKPIEVKEEAILKTYRISKEIEKGVSTISTELGCIRKLLVDLEWVKKFPDFKDYRQLWTEKQTALKKDDLGRIDNALNITRETANKWKETRKREIESAFLKIERMSKSVHQGDLETEVASLEESKQGVNWGKPDLESLSTVLSQVDNLVNRLRNELINTLQSADDTSIIEEPEIIENLGEKKGWDFERFFGALEVVLRNGLIEIRAIEGE
jgi:hypothetical protein